MQDWNKKKLAWDLRCDAKEMSKGKENYKWTSSKEKNWFIVKSLGK